MNHVLFIVLGLYMAPLLFIVARALASIAATDPGRYYVMANNISETFILGFRDAIGAIVLPFLAVFAIPTKPTPETPIARITKILVGTLAFAFLLTRMAFAWFISHETAITDSQGANAEQMKNAIESYGKDILTYIALQSGFR